MQPGEGSWLCTLIFPHKHLTPDSCAASSRISIIITGSLGACHRSEQADIHQAWKFRGMNLLILIFRKRNTTCTHPAWKQTQEAFFTQGK